ncbi:MAG: hypothetical protein FWD48_03815 [Oscillospiraceae bacterium]|nr:hypothetical protein [Oscillospiraceae bacterium]
MKNAKKDIIKNIIIAVLSVAVVALIFIPMLDFGEDSATRVTERTQIERRFLVDFENLPRDKMTSSTDIVQSYISLSPEMRLRNNNGTDFVFTLRTPVDEAGIIRRDIEFDLTKDEYNQLFQRITGTVIHKARYRVNYDGVDVRIDIFFGDLDGLVFAEVLFDSEEESLAFQPLSWFGEDITEDMRYRNANLSKDGMPVNN